MLVEFSDLIEHHHGLGHIGLRMFLSLVGKMIDITPSSYPTLLDIAKMKSPPSTHSIAEGRDGPLH